MGMSLTIGKAVLLYEAPYRGVLIVPLQIGFIHKNVVIATSRLQALVWGYKWTFRQVSALFSFK